MFNNLQTLTITAANINIELEILRHSCKIMSYPCFQNSFDFFQNLASSYKSHFTFRKVSLNAKKFVIPTLIWSWHYIDLKPLFGPSLDLDPLFQRGKSTGTLWDVVLPKDDKNLIGRKRINWGSCSEGHKWKTAEDDIIQKTKNCRTCIDWGYTA